MANGRLISSSAFAKSNLRRNIGNVGTRIFGGRMSALDNSTPSTYQLTLSTELPYDAVRLIFANSELTPYTISGCKFIGLTQASDYNRSTGTFNTVTFGGSVSGIVPAAPGANRRSLFFSDWILAPSVARTDGGLFPLISARAYISTAGTIGALGDTGFTYTNWASRADGRRAVMRSQVGDCVTTPASFTTTTNINRCPIIGIQYMARGRVVNVMGIGDSLTEGRATYTGGGWGFQACNSLNDQALGMSFEWSNLGWSGQSSQLYFNRAIDDLPYFADTPFDIGFMPNYSPNDAAASPTNGTVRASAGRAIFAAGLMRKYDTSPILWTGLPTDVSQYNIGANDQWRQQRNAEAVGEWAAKGIDVLDINALVQNPTILPSGQYEFAPGMTLDGTHLSDTADALVAIPAAAVIRSVLQL